MSAWLAFGAFGLSVLGAEAARRFAVSRALLDLPGPRRSHSLPTPRGGGAGFAIA
ncbi:MAG: glycosyl transferase, partial [Gammaproteobacteria bacterium HGW-Gammaproteobacteria-7]